MSTLLNSSGGLCPRCKIHGGIMSTYTKMSRGDFVLGGGGGGAGEGDIVLLKSDCPVQTLGK